MSRYALRMVIYAVLLLLVSGGVAWRAQQWFGGQPLSGPPRPFDHPKQIELPQIPGQRYLILYHDHDDIAEVELARQSVEVSLQYGRLPYAELTFDQWKRSNADTRPYRQGAIIVLGEQQQGLAHLEQLQAYVRDQGGVLINGLRSPSSPLNPFFGIVDRPTFQPGAVTGWHWRDRLYPVLSEHDLTAAWERSSSLDVHLAATAHVYAESVSAPHVPYLWMVAQGRGQALYWNTTTLESKALRGVFLQSMLLAQGVGAKCTVAAQVWYIDDFPAPAYERVSPGNRTGLTDANFRLQRFDPDMQEIAKKYGIAYSCGAIFLYNATTSPPFGYTNEAFQKLYRLEVGLAAQRGEIGLHGYNHIPLRLQYTEAEKKANGYPPFPAVQTIRAQLAMANSLWMSVINREGPYFYVPPSNMLSPQGKQALYEQFPQLKTISAVYNSTAEIGAFEQEFLPDPQIRALIGTPRITSGYLLDANQQFLLGSGVGTLGVVSHFNHPDDVFDPVRSQGKSWEQLRAGFAQLVGTVNSAFPWLQPMTATELSDQLRRYYQTQVLVDRAQPGRLNVYLSPLAAPMTLEVRVPHPDKWSVLRGGAVVAQSTAYGLLWVTATEPHLVLEGGT